MAKIKNTTATRRQDRSGAKQEADKFKPGRGRQIAPLVRPLLRVSGLMTNPVEADDRESEIEWVEYVWNHPAMLALRNFVDSEEAGWETDYKWSRSSLLFIAVVSLALGRNLKRAHTLVKTDPHLRRIGGFQSRPLRRDRRKIRGATELEVDPFFPTRQSADDFINRWVGGKKPASRSPWRTPSFMQDEVISTRGRMFLALVEKQMQEIAFAAILEYDLDRSRLVTDGSIVISGHARENLYRTDYGAKWFQKANKSGRVENYYCRILGSVQLVSTPFVIVAQVVRPDEGEIGIAKDVLLPRAAEASRRFVQFAKDHGIEHKGFDGAAVFADGELHNHPVIEATFQNGFLPAYGIGNDTQKILGSRELPNAAGELVTVDLRDDGALLCRCPASTHVREREPMRRTVEHPGRSANVHCDRCNAKYFVTPRGPDEKTAAADRGDIDLRYDITLPRWDPRVTALSFKARNEIEARHALMEDFNLLPDGRGGPNWRSLTGDFRHAFWYGLGHLLWNIRVELNLHRIEERQEYTWAEGYAGYHRNRRQLDRLEDLEALRAAREARRRRRKQKPKYKPKGNHVPTVRRALYRIEDRELPAALTALAQRVRFASAKSTPPG